MRIAFRFAAFVIFLTLVACGKPLGEYEARNVTVVASGAEPDRQVEKSETHMLRVEFTSKTDLYEASDGGGEGLYVFSSFCPYDEKRTLYVGEPYYDDRSRYGPTRVLEGEVLTDGRSIYKVEIDERRPTKNLVTGEFTYTTYLALARVARPEQPGRDEQLAYDLRRQPRDLCLRINHPGYFITPSRSRVFKVPALLIKRAVLNDKPRR